jgi:hypothetical protein
MTKIKFEFDAQSHEQVGLRTSAAPNKIGVVSPITMTPILQNAFANGVGNSRVNIKYADKNKYDKGDNTALQKAIKVFNNSADLIVTAGGLVAFGAADQAASIHFVSLTGAEPSPSSSLFRGGVSLESVNSNSDRISLILGLGKGFTIGQIGLLCNANSAMNNDEIQDWRFGTGTSDNSQIFTAGNDTSKNNTASTYASDLSAIPNGIKALVISADPFFQDTMDLLILACNNWIAAGAAMSTPIVRYVVYPSLIYANQGGTNKPTSKSTSLYGPDLVAAYFLLGQVAAIVLVNDATLPSFRLGNSRQDL